MDSEIIKILAVDDNNDNLITIRALIKEGFPNAQIYTASSGIKAIELASTHYPDVILLDIIMPDVDGYEVCKILKTDAFLRDIPVVFITALVADKNIRIKALEVGAEGFLTKPVDESELKAQIRAMVKIKFANVIKSEEKQLLAAEIKLQNKKLKDNNQALLYTMENLKMEMQERKKTEIELVNAKDKAEESDRLKSAFLANMSHEIRTPMNGILGFADLLKKPNLSGEKQQKYIGIIEKSGERMLNIINDIVSISKIEAGLMGVNKQESNINEQIEYIYTFFKPEIENKGMQILYRNSLTSKEAILYTDREKVFAILTNLVKNAIKYTLEGSIELGYTLQQAQGSIGESVKPAELEFYVKDSGIGIPKDRQKAVFERFVQADIEDKNAYQGAGLGLAISNAYVEMLGGKMWLESEEGIGTIFYFTLPYITEAEDDALLQNDDANINALVEDNSEEYRLKILIAEDDEASEMLITTIVDDFGEVLLNAQNGIEAVNICRDNPDIDLILMDIQMPEMNGYEATKNIRKFNKEVVIIAITAYALEGDREKAIFAGCDDYISKPIKEDALKQMIIKYRDKK